MSPYKSDAQRKKMHALAAEGKVKQSVVDEFDKASKGMTLPAKAKKVAPRFKKRGKK